MAGMSGSTASAAPASRRLEGKVAIITGGASGIGACTAKLFVVHGAKVIIADVQDDLGLSLCKEIASENISYVHCDVTNDSDVKNLVDIAISKYEKLDIMYSNAGITGQHKMSILEAENDDFKKIIDVNLYGGFLCAKYAARTMVPAKKGVILFTSSNSSVTSGIGSHAYVASKSGIVGLAKNLCVDLGLHGIRVNCISPFFVATPMLTKHFGFINTLNFGKIMLNKLYNSVSVLKGSVLEAEDVAETALYLASDESRIISGQNIVIDGGYSVTNLIFTNKIKGLMSYYKL
ncbi:hypothetical protein Nepgr_028201 [Nepenthes gracilis]|uniref:Secoisolariciresinol dehydrogenase n=1 Tax=Nepenthes gracilis TaxID=150966 RepID=A0AAD3TA77_NEPGR|nr:hypothetical protein Nepgr_028201 [Nepenthes gracilis]